MTSYASKWPLASEMTLRDYFAAQALARPYPPTTDSVGYLSNTDEAKDAYAIADAMLAEREKKR